MLIVNDKLKLAEGYFSSTFLGFYIDDDSGKKTEVIVKQVTDEVVYKQVVNEKQEKSSKKRNEKHNSQISKSEFENKRQQLLEILEKEARIAESLSHPNLIKTLGYKKFKGRPSLIYDYANCGTLSERLENIGKLEIGEFIDLLDQLSNGLAYLHSFSNLRALIHMDLNPSNILYSSDGRIRIADFGLTQETSLQIDGHTSSHLLTNYSSYSNRIYSAPEIIHKKVAYQSSDLWALAIILFQALTGKNPVINNKPINQLAVDSKSRRKAINYILRHVRNQLTNSNSELTKEIVFIIRGLMSEPDKTPFRSAANLCNHLDQIRATNTSPLGKIFKKIDGYRESLTRAQTLLTHVSTQPFFYGHVKNTDSLNEENLINLDSSLNKQFQAIQYAENEMKLACKSLGLKFNKNSQKGGEYTYEFFDLLLGSIAYYIAVDLWLGLLNLTRISDELDSKDSVNTKLIEFYDKWLSDTKKLLTYAIFYLGRVLIRNKYAANCAYLYNSAMLIIATIDLRYFRHQYDLGDILLSISDLMLEYAHIVKRRPSFENLFNLERIQSEFSNLMGDFMEKVQFLMEIHFREDLSDEEKEQQGLAILSELANRDLSDEKELILFLRKLSAHFKNIQSFQSIRAELFNYMFDSLMT